MYHFSKNVGNFIVISVVERLGLSVQRSLDPTWCGSEFVGEFVVLVITLGDDGTNDRQGLEMIVH